MRRATPDDVPAVERVVQAAYEHYISRIGRRPAPMDADYRALVPDTWLLDDGADVVGLVVIIAESDHLLIDTVAVAPQAQGRGHGRTLLAHAETRARQLGLPRVRLYTNAAMTENLAMYPKLGYIEVDRRREDGFDRVYFVKDVPASTA